MRIVLVEIKNFRGIKQLKWAPAEISCLIGPGDSTKTTILDAIELALNPRSYLFADDSDFFNLNVKDPIIITITLTDLPSEFISDDHYGTHLRGWNREESRIEDEPREGMESVLSVRVKIGMSLEARWSIFNERIDEQESDPPVLRYAHAKQLAVTRLGPYAERHLGWGRQSVLMRFGKATDNINLQLAEASRAARETFRKNNENVFKDTVAHVEKLGERFSVPVREKYAAELDVKGVDITAGGLSLHDGNLPLRRLGTGSTRLIVSALQHDAGGSHIALIDEVEHGLEPHRIARLLNYLKFPTIGEEKEKTSASQIFITTHSPVVIRELTVSDIFAVRSNSGVTDVRSVAATAKSIDIAQRHLRRSPDAFLARRVLIAEGRTECGLLRGLDTWWSKQAKDSFALRGAISIDGEGRTNAPIIAEHLLDLGYDILLLVDSDEPLPVHIIESVKKKGAMVCEWLDSCATEERIFLDVPWMTVAALIEYASECVGAQSVRDAINSDCLKQGRSLMADLTLPTSLDSPEFRRCVGRAAKNKNNPWFKSVTGGERLAELIAPCLGLISAKPLAITISKVRTWIDA